MRTPVTSSQSYDRLLNQVEASAKRFIGRPSAASALKVTAARKVSPSPDLKARNPAFNQQPASPQDGDVISSSSGQNSQSNQAAQITSNVGSDQGGRESRQLALDLLFIKYQDADGKEGSFGPTLNVDVDTDPNGGQAGVDLGVAIESNFAFFNRVEHGVTVNGDVDLDSDGKGGQAGIDVGFFQEFDQSHRGEAGVTANVDYRSDDDGTYVGAKVGLFAEEHERGDRGEVGVTVRGGYRADGRGGFQAGIDAGIYGEADTSGKGMSGVTANIDVQTDGKFNQAGLDVGGFAHVNGRRVEGGATVNGSYESTANGGKAAADVGVYAEGENGERYEAGVTVGGKAEATNNSGTIGAQVGVFAENAGGRNEAVVGAEVGYETDEYGVTLKAGLDVFGLEIDGAVRVGVEAGTWAADAVDFVKDVAEDVAKGMKDFVEDPIGTTVEAVEEAGEAVGEIVEDVIETAGDVIEGAGEMVEETGEAIAEGAEAVWNWLTGNGD